RGHPWLRRAALRRQHNREARQPSRIALDADLAAVVLDDAVAHRKPEAGALAHVLGGEERIEHLADVLGGDAGAVVFEFDAQMARLAARLGAAVERGADGNP